MGKSRLLLDCEGKRITDFVGTVIPHVQAKGQPYEMVFLSFRYIDFKELCKVVVNLSLFLRLYIGQFFMRYFRKL